MNVFSRPVLPVLSSFLLSLLLLFAPATESTRAQSLSFTILRRLVPNPEGRLTYAPLTQGADGLLYGAASRGGAADRGTLFRLAPDGSGFTVLHTFNGPPGDGALAENGLIQGRDGLLYGTTLAGGGNDRGLLFRLAPDGGGFQGLAALNLGYPGATPTAALVEGSDGALYGTAEFGGLNNFGTVFRFGVPNGGLSEIAEFVGSPGAANPAGRLLALGGGAPDVLYGATLAGGFSNVGALFAVNADGSGRREVFSFSGNFDGALPRPLTLGPDGALYGVTRTGGLFNYGNVFRLDFSGNFSVLYSFNPSDGTGYDAFAELLLASDGNFYGTTRRGGFYDAGTVYRISPFGGFATLYSFTSTGGDGGYPQAALVQGSDGRLFGVAAGQEGQFATVFRLDLGLPRPRPTIVRALLTAAVNGSVGGDTLALVGENFVGARGVRFAATTTDEPAPVVAPIMVVSGRYALTTIPAGAATAPGAVAVLDADGQPGPVFTVTFTAADVPAPPVSLSVVTLVATDPNAKRGDSTQSGRFQILRTADTFAQALTVRFNVQADAGAARRGVDYELVCHEVVLPVGTDDLVILADEASADLEVVPLPGGRKGTVKVRLVADPGYTLGRGVKGTVKIK